MPPIVRRANDTDRPAWDAFVAARPEGDLLQAWGWGECTALANEPPKRILVEDAGSIRGVAQVLMRAAGLGMQIAYVPHGPLWDRSVPDADRIFAWLIHGLRTLARKERALVVKMDPRAEPDDSFDFSHLADEHALRRGPDLQAPTTRIVDLLDGGEQLEASWHADARSLSKRAAREGTEVTIARQPDDADLSVLHGLLADVAEHADFRVRSPDFLARLAAEFASSGGWYQGIARVDGTPIATMAFPRVGDRAYYLYGALLRDERYKHNYGSHAVVAEMLRTLAADGCRAVDMWGVAEPDDPGADPAWKGFSDFKRRFGGTPLRHPGLYDLVTHSFWYRVRAIRERVSRTTHHRAGDG
jgi:lipid II:glycine glycyltransferase (peptidoglycan interpeptide bridge formation enzyme)